MVIIHTLHVDASPIVPWWIKLEKKYAVFVVYNWIAFFLSCFLNRNISFEFEYLWTWILISLDYPPLATSVLVARPVASIKTAY